MVIKRCIANLTKRWFCLRFRCAYNGYLNFVLTALHGMQTRSTDQSSVCPSVRPSVRPSLCLSVTRVHYDKTVERSVEIYIPYERTFNIVLWEEEWLVEATTSTWNFGSTGPHWSKIADFEPIIARSASAVTSNEKNSINANKKSTTRFSCNEPKMIVVRCP